MKVNQTENLVTLTHTFDRLEIDGLVLHLYDRNKLVATVEMPATPKPNVVMDLQITHGVALLKFM